MINVFIFRFLKLIFTFSWISRLISLSCLCIKNDSDILSYFFPFRFLVSLVHDANKISRIKCYKPNMVVWRLALRGTLSLQQWRHVRFSRPLLLLSYYYLRGDVQFLTDCRYVKRKRSEASYKNLLYI